MNNKLLKIGVTLLAIIVLLGGGIYVKNKSTANEQGHIIVELIDLDGNQVVEKELSFSEGDNLQKLIEDNFNNVTFDNGMLMTIENYETPPDWSTYLAVYVDGKMSQVGIPEIELHDGIKISLIVTEFKQ